MLTLETGGELIETGLDMHDDATLTIESGATLAEIATSTASYIPFGLTANGTVTIDAATLASGGEYMFVGELTTTGGPGNCTFTASDGATITALATDLAEDTGDSATVTLTGDGTTWTNTFDTPVDSNDAGFNVGVEGNGSLLIEAGATLSNPLAYIKIGQFVSATGTATVTDPGSTMSAGGLLRVGDSGHGTLTVENFALASVGEVQVGVYSSSTGLLTITSGGTLTTNGATTVDTGAQGGGAATLTAGEFDIGVLAHAQGTVSVDGGTLTVEGDLFVGDGGSGSLSVEGGGTVSAVNADIGTSTGAGTVTLGVGGTLIATAVHVGANGVVNMAGGVLDPPDTVTIDAAGDISGYGTVTGPIVDNGSITATGGTLDLTGDVSGGGTLILMPDAALQLEGTIAGTASIVFTGSQEALILGSAAEVDAPVSGLGAGDSITLEGQAVASAVYDTTNSQLAITGSGGAMFTLTLSGIHQQSDFIVVDGDVAVACFLSGTRIATEFGDVRLETLAISDRVHTRFSGLAGIKWIGRRHIDCRRHPNPRKVWPVRVRAGAFGDGAPGRDLFLSPDHAVFVDDVLIPVRYLINGDTIAQQPRDAVTYFHVELERHDVIFAEGLTCESYLDTGNRSNFEGASLPIVPHPDVSAWSWEARGCAPLVITGAALEAAQRRLVSKGSPLAGSRGSAPGLTMSPATRRPRHRTARDTPDPLPSRRYAPKAC
jgi:T5SS/PEP-CTERM-associated repeat protein